MAFPAPCRPCSPQPLQKFLWTKLATLGRTDRAQATLVAAWLTELLLDSINREVLQVRLSLDWAGLRGAGFVRADGSLTCC